MNQVLNFKYYVAIFMLLAATLVFATQAFAHVTVKPNQVGVGAYQTFNVSVPNEKDNPTVGIRLVIPGGLEHVSPNVKPGWNVLIKKSGEGEEAVVTELIWTGGSIPEGQRDDFFFSGKTPADATELNWKAYQTYSDGVIIAWDLAKDAQPKNAEGKDDFSASGPYSITKVVNDLAAAPKPASAETMVKAETSSNMPLILSALAVILSGFSLGLNLRKK